MDDFSRFFKKWMTTKWIKVPLFYENRSIFLKQKWINKKTLQGIKKLVGGEISISTWKVAHIGTP